MHMNQPKNEWTKGNIHHIGDLSHATKEERSPLYEMINVSLNMRRLEKTHSIVIVAEESPSHNHNHIMTDPRPKQPLNTTMAP